MQSESVPSDPDDGALQIVFDHQIIPDQMKELNLTEESPIFDHQIVAGQNTNCSITESPILMDEISTTSPSSEDVAERLFSLFEKFCKFGIPSGHSSAISLPLMDGSRYVKLFKDAGIFQKYKKASSVDCDIVFNSIKRIQERKINFDQFGASIGVFAARIGVPEKEILDLLLACPGPVLVGITTPTAPVFATEAPRIQMHTFTARHSIGSPYKFAHRRESEIKPSKAPRLSLRTPDEKMPAVFERLCDVSQFTGTQKQKMNELRVYRPAQ